MEDNIATIRKLKSDLETERQRVKQSQREKVHEVRQAKQEATRERDRAIAEASKRLQADHTAELAALRETLARQKEHDVRHALKQKDEEIRHVREQLAREKTAAVRRAAAGARRETMDAFRDQIESDRAKSMEELWMLRAEKTRLEDEVRQLRETERENVDAMRRLRGEFETEREALIRKSKVEAARDAQQIRLAERIVQQKEREASIYQQQAKMLVVEKETLGDELSRFREAESWEKRFAAKNESIAEGLEREMMTKTNRYRDQIRTLEEKNASLRSEISSLRQGGEREQQQEEKVKRLRQRNKELVALARRLEDQNKALKKESATGTTQPNMNGELGGQELEAYKKAVARERAKEQAEHARVLSARKKEADELGERLAKKERELEALHQTMNRKETYADSAKELAKLREKVEALEVLMRAMAKEKLHFERNLTENPTSAARLRDLQARFDALEYSKKRADETLAAKDFDLTELREKVSRLEEKEKDLKAAVQKLASDNARLESELELCVTTRADLERRISFAEEKTKEAEAIKEHCTNVENQLQQTEETLTVTQGENTRLLKKIEETEKKFKIAESDINQLRFALKAAESKLAERDAEIASLRENPLQMSLSGNDMMEELQARVRELEEECAEKELQHIALQDRLEQFDDAAAAASTPKLDLEFGFEDEKAGELRRRSSTEILIDSLQDSDDSDSDSIVGFLKNSRGKNGIIDKVELNPKKSKKKSLKSEEEKQRKNASPPPPIGSLRDELAALGENVESDYDTPSSESDDGDSDGVLDLLKDSETKSKSTEIRDVEEKENKAPPLTENRSGSVAVFVAKFNYNPELDSPNDNPEAELSLKRGEYVYVYGDADEDGFYTGETENGRKGLVPSNFVDQMPVDSPPPVTDDDLTLKRVYSPAFQLNSVELETVEEEDEDALSGMTSPKDTSTSIITPNENILNSEEPESDGVLPPSELKIEREFSRSLLVRWTGPKNVPAKAIQGYRVYIDGEFKTKTAGSFKHRALIEGLDLLSGKMKLTVRTVVDRGESRDSNFLLIGKAPIPPPADVKVGVSLDGQRALNVVWKPTSQLSCPESKLTGYKVYIDDVTATHVYDPTASSVAINQFTISTLYTIANPHQLCVTTTSVDGESKRSKPVTFSDEMLRAEEGEVEVRDNSAPSAAPAESELKISDVGGGKNDANDVHCATEKKEERREIVANSSKPPALSSMFELIDKEEGDEEEEEETRPSGSDSEEIIEVFSSPARPSASPPSKSDSAVQKKFEIVSVESSPPPPKEPVTTGGDASMRRRFLALFNYNPSTMSPNDDAEEELAFNKGDIILISGEKDEDGFYVGELNGRQGVVPSNMISELADSGCAIEEVSAASNASSPSPAVEELVSDNLGRPMIALYNYDPVEMSPNPDAEAELDFRAGELVYVIGDIDEDGFYQGRKPTGEQGLVPSNFLAPVKGGEEKEDRIFERVGDSDQVKPSSPPEDANTSGSEQRKKKKGFLTKGKNLVKRLGRVGRSKNK